MSGPKSSRYTLTAEQLRRILEEQERLRKELEEKAKQERECKEARTFLSATKSRLKRHDDMIRSKELLVPTGSASRVGLQDRYRSLHLLIERIEQICSVNPNSSHDTLVDSKKEADRLFKELQSMEVSVLVDTDSALMEQKILEDSKVAESMNVSFASVGIVETQREPVFDEVIGALEELKEMELSRELLAEVTQVLNQAKTIESVSAMQNFSSITVVPLRRRCNQYLAFAEENKEQFEQLLDKYHALCKQLDARPKQFSFSIDGLKDLRLAVDDLECQATQDAEQAYIRQSVDEVMAEMGYDVIGHRHVKKKSGKEFSCKLLTYEDGTVINVTESSSGQITMEIGGTDSRDRLPDANERVALRKTMESFCRDFQEIERRLSERGVILDSRLSMAPPEEAYAQIINLEDYELVEDYQATKSKKRVNRASGKKQMSGE